VLGISSRSSRERSSLDAGSESAGAPSRFSFVGASRLNLCPSQIDEERVHRSLGAQQAIKHSINEPWYSPAKPNVRDNWIATKTHQLDESRNNTSTGCPLESGIRCGPIRGGRGC
jgi:hypothetical protein